MPWAPIAAAVIGGLFQARGQRKQRQQQNKYSTNAAFNFDPGQIQNRMRGYDPNLFGAMMSAPGVGREGLTGYGQNLWDIAQDPGYIDPRLMNMPLQQNERRTQNDLIAARGQLGRSQMGLGSGLGQAYTLANMAGGTARNVGIHQQYAMQREMQRRADLAFLQNAYQQLQGSALQGAGGAAGFENQQQAPQTGSSMFGNAIQMGLQAYSQFPRANQQGQQSAQENPWDFGNQGNFESQPQQFQYPQSPVDPYAQTSQRP